MSQGRLWFVRRGETVRGPFHSALIKRYLLVGRIKPTDEVSLDRHDWLPVTAYPAFAAEQPSASGMAAVSASVLGSEDERRPGDRRQGEGDSPYKNQRSGKDRRAPEAPEVLERRQRRARVLASLKGGPINNRVPALVAVLLFVAIVVSGILFTPQSRQPEPVCDAAAAPGVDWANCRKEGIDLAGADLQHAVLRNAVLTGANLAGAKLVGADLAYADFSNADFSSAAVNGADLKGANLRKARLAGANFEDADLSYADLTGADIEGTDFKGARLESAIWVDGRECVAGSVGRCVTKP
jgi:hypothetical protein